MSESLGFALLAAAGNVLGALAVARRTAAGLRAIEQLVAFGAGFMLSVAIVEILPETFSRSGAAAPALVLGGYLAVHLTQHTVTPHFHFGEETHAVSGVAGTSALVYGFTMQILHGHAVTGQGSHGAIWGIVVANIVNFIGISHVGIAISAVVRILRLQRYQQLARLAEFITLAAITTAVTNIAMDVGHPERFVFNVMWFGRYHAPFVWSCTVITTYVVGSSVYLYLAMRRDLWLSSEKAPVRRWLFRALALGYRDTPASRARH